MSLQPEDGTPTKTKDGQVVRPLTPSSVATSESERHPSPDFGVRRRRPEGRCQTRDSRRQPVSSNTPYYVRLTVPYRQERGDNVNSE